MSDLTKLTFAALPQLDGKIEALLQKHLVNIAEDCMRRPQDQSPRKVLLEFSVVPQTDPDTGECDEVWLTVEAKSKVPVYRTKAYPLRVSRGGLAFNADVPDSLDQRSLFPRDGKDEQQA